MGQSAQPLPMTERQEAFPKMYSTHGARASKTTYYLPHLSATRHQIRESTRASTAARHPTALDEGQK